MAKVEKLLAKERRQTEKLRAEKDKAKQKRAELKTAVDQGPSALKRELVAATLQTQRHFDEVKQLRTSVQEQEKVIELGNKRLRRDFGEEIGILKIALGFAEKEKGKLKSVAHTPQAGVTKLKDGQEECWSSKQQVEAKDSQMRREGEGREAETRRLLREAGKLKSDLGQARAESDRLK